MTDTLAVPLIIRGKVIEEGYVEYSGRHGVAGFRTPDIRPYVNELTLPAPSSMRDLYDISLEEIIAHLGRLGDRPISTPIPICSRPMICCARYRASRARWCAIN